MRGNGSGPTKVAVIGSGNIGTDLMIKILRLSGDLEIAAMAGIDPGSDGLARARRLKVATTHQGVEGLAAMDEFAEVEIVFDATSAGAHRHHDEVLRALGRRVVDLTPAAVGPFVVPPVNLHEHLGAPNVNMVTCGARPPSPSSPPSRPSARSTTARSSRPSPHAPPDRVPAPTSTSSPRRPPRPSRRSVVRRGARRSSSSIRPSRR